MKSLKTELDEAERELNHLQEQVMEYLSRNGLARTHVDGVTVYVVRDIQVSPKDGDYEAATRALQEAGLGALVQARYNTNSLKSSLKEMEEAGELPQVIKNAFNVYETFRLGAVASQKTSKSAERFLKSS